VVGALVGGVVADRLGLNWAVGAVAALTFASGLVTIGRLPETRAPVEPRALTPRSL
jgi:predicted MFS family arabinose efflux permease